MRRIGCLVVLVLLLSASAACARDLPFALGRPVAVTHLLPPPPLPGSPEERAELGELLALQQARTPEMVEQVRADAERSAFRFADVLGPGFVAEKLPRATPFFEALKQAAQAMDGDGKQYWNRARPAAVDPAIKPCIKTPDSPAYPSGHATYGTLVSIVLANMVPERQRELYARGQAYGFAREVAGVHFPSDVAAGRIVGTLIAAVLLEDPSFMAAFAEAKAEVRRALGLPERE
ncbi:MAG: acid phosphatase [Solidesulfovibrio sp. DCME]|uniref:acid phosphatase n=1 Tax=Solidesulfovibrio sp. DCME TaxID=3447380 RepID=UPI003D0E19F1